MRREARPAPRTDARGDKAEVFEEALARVSRRLGALAREQADELRAERLLQAKGERQGRATSSAARRRRPRRPPRATGPPPAADARAQEAGRLDQGCRRSAPGHAATAVDGAPEGSAAGTGLGPSLRAMLPRAARTRPLAGLLVTLVAGSRAVRGLLRAGDQQGTRGRPGPGRRGLPDPAAGPGLPPESGRRRGPRRPRRQGQGPDPHRPHRALRAVAERRHLHPGRRRRRSVAAVPADGGRRAGRRIGHGRHRLRGRARPGRAACQARRRTRSVVRPGGGRAGPSARRSGRTCRPNGPARRSGTPRRGRTPPRPLRPWSSCRPGRPGCGTSP